MDPVTQGFLGAALSQSSTKRKDVLWAGLCGLAGGLAPDLDTFIRSQSDPLLYLEYHRHFTHSLIFIPIGGFLCAILMHILIGRFLSPNFRKTFIFCTLGYATHGFLDASTSYGTMLLWPFSDMRFAWNLISIIDPLFTGPILILVGVAIWKKAAFYARAAIIWALLYLFFGAYQNQQAIKMGHKISSDRGHTPASISAKPSFGNLLVWKVIYQHENTYYVDAVRVTYRPKIYAGQSIKALDIPRDFPWLDKKSQQAKDIERFRWFSKGFLAQDPKNLNRIIDLRYSLLPNEIAGLWSIELSPTAPPDYHARYLVHRDASRAKRKVLLQMIFE